VKGPSKLTAKKNKRETFTVKRSPKFTTKKKNDEEKNVQL